MITINIQGHGTFTINSNKINELLQWLHDNAVRLESGTTKISGDDVLLNG